MWKGGAGAEAVSKAQQTELQLAPAFGVTAGRRHGAAACVCTTGAVWDCAGRRYTDVLSRENAVGCTAFRLGAAVQRGGSSSILTALNCSVALGGARCCFAASGHLLGASRPHLYFCQHSEGGGVKEGEEVPYSYNFFSCVKMEDQFS